MHDGWCSLDSNELFGVNQLVLENLLTESKWNIQNSVICFGVKNHHNGTLGSLLVTTILLDLLVTIMGLNEYLSSM